MVSNDLYSEYGLDCGGDYIKTKSWPWLRHRILGLLSVDSRITRWAQSQAKG